METIKYSIFGMLFLLIPTALLVGTGIIDISLPESKPPFGMTPREKYLSKQLDEAKIDQTLARYLAQINLGSTEAKEVVKLINAIQFDNKPEMKNALLILSKYQKQQENKHVLDINQISHKLGVELKI